MILNISKFSFLASSYLTFKDKCVVLGHTFVKFRVILNKHVLILILIVRISQQLTAQMHKVKVTSLLDVCWMMASEINQNKLRFAEKCFRLVNNNTKLTLSRMTFETQQLIREELRCYLQQSFGELLSCRSLVVLDKPDKCILFP